MKKSHVITGIQLERLAMGLTKDQAVESTAGYYRKTVDELQAIWKQYRRDSKRAKKMIMGYEIFYDEDGGGWFYDVCDTKGHSLPNCESKLYDSRIKCVEAALYFIRKQKGKAILLTGAN